MTDPTERDQERAEELLEAWEAGGKGYGDLAERIAVALAEAKADTRVAVLRDAAGALRQADLATRDERHEEGWR